MPIILRRGTQKRNGRPSRQLALVFLGVVDRYKPKWVVWENVPGVHSSWSDAAVRSQSQECKNTVEEIRRLGRSLGIDAAAYIGHREVEAVDQSNDFDCFLSGLAELGYGIATTILDAASHWDRGPAQRRERVFVVGHIGDVNWQRAAAVLL